jgi:uncharacterized Zn finger protein
VDPWFWRRERTGGPLPVEGGIRARSRRGDIGETWWSRRFIAILESFDLGSRLERGRSYARRGQVMDLEVSRGVVEARVQGSRPKPYRVRLGVETIAERDWARVERAMAARAVFAARLLAGEMPREIEEAFAACGLTLFPASARELSSACSCPDWASPCKHVAAVFYLLAESFDRDPFQVFAWRGRTREELLERLGALRASRRAPASPAPPPPEPPPAATPERFWEAGPELEQVRVRPWSAEAREAAIRQLGPIGIRAGRVDLAEVLAAGCRAAAEAAQRRALGE